MARTGETKRSSMRGRGGPDARPAIVLPRDARAALAARPGALAAFEALSYTHRREHVEAITEAKKPETRERRIARMVEAVAAGTAGRHPVNSTRPAALKMGIKPGSRVLVLDADAAAMAIFDGVPAGTVVATEPASTPHDVVVLFAPTAAALKRRLAAALKACVPGGTLWIAYLKQSSGRATTLTRDAGWDPTERDDLARISMIALDDAWAGSKFRRVPA